MKLFSQRCGCPHTSLLQAAERRPGAVTWSITEASFSTVNGFPRQAAAPMRCTDWRHVDLFKAGENDRRWSRRRRIDCFQDRQTVPAWVQINDNHIHRVQAAVQDAKGFEARVRPNHLVTAFHGREGNELGRIWISIYEEQNIRFHLNAD